MLFQWDDDTIRWFVQASEFTGYHEKLANELIPMVTDYKTLCDIGCGLGLLEEHLGAVLDKITCMDINKNAINYINKAINQKKISNVETRLQSCDDLQENFDCILLSFFGSRNFKKFLPFCRKLIMIVGGNNKAHMYPKKIEDKGLNSYHEIEKKLIAEKMEYCLKRITLEFGQPFYSLEDARNYISNLAKDTSQNEIDKFLQDNLKGISFPHDTCKKNNIEITVEPQYAYYMPHPKELGIFEVKGLLECERKDYIYF